MGPHRLTTTLIPLTFLTTISLIIYYLLNMSSIPSPPTLPTPKPTTKTTHNIYTAPTSYFLQSHPTTNASTFDPFSHSLGLIPQPYDSDTSFPSLGHTKTSQWPRFIHYLRTLNANSSSTGIFHRLLILTRHGEGWHNVAERFFGTERWDCVFAGLDGTSREKGKGGISWADAELTGRGVAQARELKGGLERSILIEEVELPERFFVSPLRRAVGTGVGVWRGLVENDKKGEGGKFRMVVKEGLREGIGIHTCDRRSSRAEIEGEFPDGVVEFEEGFKEEDGLWEPDSREPGVVQMRRVRDRVLDEIFGGDGDDGSLVVSMTSHGGTIQSILRAVGHREFEVKTGGILPVVVRVEVVEGGREREGEVKWEGKPECVGGEPGEEEVEEMLRRFEESVEGDGSKL